MLIGDAPWLDPAALDRLRQFDEQLMAWQRSINLIAASTVAERWRRHFLDSAQLDPLLRQSGHRPGASLLDMGSGAGFPSLVLAACGWEQVHSVEAVGKKAAFQRQVVRSMGVTVHIHQQRLEDMSPFPVDIVTARGCAHVTQLLDWAWPFCHSKTEFWFLKGQHLDDELTDAAKYWQMDQERYRSQSDDRGWVLRLTSLRKR